MIEIRTCDGNDELNACVQLEIARWGYDKTETVPCKTFLLAQKIGGQVIGAFEKADGEGPEARTSLIGFAMALPAIKSSGGAATPYLHSHMLAVREDYRNRGIGVQLKLEQRREALERGIRHMEWTFDPLEIKNAFLNLCKLGAVCRRYRANFYGVSTSRLQGGLPTDRLVAEWEMDAPRVRAILDGRPAGEQIIEERIVVPAAIKQWKTSGKDHECALSIQKENRLKFEQAFLRGLTVLSFKRDPQGNGIYELGTLRQPD